MAVCVPPPPVPWLVLAFVAGVALGVALVAGMWWLNHRRGWRLAAPPDEHARIEADRARIAAALEPLAPPVDHVANRATRRATARRRPRRRTTR